MKLFVYRNLHKKNWSVMYKGKVIKHASTFALEDCVFRVREGGRQRVLRTKRKNVHAFVTGFEVKDAVFTSEMRRISYNPYRGSHFYDVNSEKDIVSAKKVIFTEEGKVFGVDVTMSV